MARRKSKPESFQGPKPLERKRLEGLPQTFDVWQVAARPVAATVQAGNRTLQPWMIVVASRTVGHILAFELAHEPPTASQMWQTLVKALTQPAAGEPHRPTEVQVRPEERVVPLHSVLSDLGIDFIATHALDKMNEVFEKLAEELVGHTQPGLLDMPGMTPESGAAEMPLVLSWVADSRNGGNQERDDLLETVKGQWTNILYAYKQFEDRKPIVLFDIQEQRIYVYPYEDFKNDMNPRDQAALAEQYEKAHRENKIVVFIRDNEQRRLVSFSMDYK